MKRESARGAYVTVLNKGAQQAGAIFVVQNHLNGTGSIYAPAPQSLLDDDGQDRKFELRLEQANQEVIDQFLDKQKQFDPDLWIIETESGSGPISLELTPILPN